MASYGTKYRIEFECIDGGSSNGQYRIDIEKSGYSASVTDLNGSANPVIINWPGGRHPLAPLKPSQVTLELEEESDGDLAEFKNFEDQEYQVKIYNNTSNLRWTGWLTSEEGYVEDMSMPNPKRVTLRAIDGAGLLQKKEFRSDPLDPDSTLRSGRASAHSIIQEALEAYWPDSTAGNYYEYAMLKNVTDGLSWTNHTPTDASNPLKGQFWEESYFMIDKVTPMTWFEVLRIILRNNFCMLTNGFHTFGAPVVICYRRFDTATSGEDLTLLDYDNTDGTINTPNTVTNMWTTTMGSTDGTETDNKFIGEKYTKSSPVKHLDVTRYRVNPNLTWPGNFEDEVWTNSTTLKTDYFESLNTPTYSKTSETETYSRASLKFTTTTTKGNQDTADGVRSLAGSGVTENPQSFIGLSFKYNLVVSSLTPKTGGGVPEIGIAFFCGGRYLQDDLTTWEAVENVIWIKVPADNLTTDGSNWVTDNFGKVGSPSPSGEVFFEVYAPVGNDYTVSYLKWDEIYAVEFDGPNEVGAYTYADAVSIASNDDLGSTVTEREELELNIMDFPKLTFSNYISANVESTVIEFGSDTYTDTAAFTLVLDGSGKTYTYKDSPGATGSGDWGGSAQTATQKIDDLILEIYYDTNNYVLTNQAGVGGRELLITALQYGDEIGAYSQNGTADTAGWNDTRTEPTDPSETEYVSKACITDDASETTSFTQKWLFNGDSSPSTNEAKHWEVIAKAYLELKESATERIQGTFRLFNEGTDQFGSLTGIDVDGGGENIYIFVSGSLNLKMLDFNGVWIKYSPATITTLGTGEIIPDGPEAKWNIDLKRPIGQLKGHEYLDYFYDYGD